MNTLSDVLDKVKARAGLLARRADDPSLTPTDGDDDVLTSFIEDGLIEIASRTDRFEAQTTITTAAGTAGYGAPAAAAHVKSVTIGGDELDHAPGDLRAQATAPDATGGKPCRYAFSEGALWLSPVPDDAYDVTLLYALNGAFVTDADNDAPDWLS